MDKYPLEARSFHSNHHFNSGWIKRAHLVIDDRSHHVFDMSNPVERPRETPCIWQWTPDETVIDRIHECSPITYSLSLKVVKYIGFVESARLITLGLHQSVQVTKTTGARETVFDTCNSAKAEMDDGHSRNWLLCSIHNRMMVRCAMECWQGQCGCQGEKKYRAFKCTA